MGEVEGDLIDVIGLFDAVEVVAGFKDDELGAGDRVGDFAGVAGRGGVARSKLPTVIIVGMSISRRRSRALGDQGLGGAVQMRTTRVSAPVFSMPWVHHGGRWMKSPFLTSRWSLAKVILPAPSTM